MNVANNTYKVANNNLIGKVSLIVGIIFLAFSGYGYFQDKTNFFLNYLTAFVFWLSVALGALFFIMIHHITGANWSTVLRRISENIAATMPLMVILFIPILFGIHELYEWSHPELVDPNSAQFDKIIYGKSGFLNIPFFYIRTAVYLIVWTWLALSLRKKSLVQDNGHNDKITSSFKKLSAQGIILFAITITFASFDWLMSLDPHWFSTIFGVYIFSGSLLAFLCFLVIMLTYHRKNNAFNNIFTIEHYHDIGKLIIAFIIFWAYMAFSQYFLIWYANLPEENYWFLYRWENSWKYISLLIIFGHFVLPFIALITRIAKRSVIFMSAVSIWILVMHYLDLYWLVLPTHHRDGIHFNFYDIAPLLGIGGLFVWYFWRLHSSKPVIPVSDPSLGNSIEFLNN
jgi:hypothetical protein